MPKDSKLRKNKESKKLSKREIILIVVASIAVLGFIITAGILIYNHFKTDEIPVAKSHALDAEPPYADGTEVFDENAFKITEKRAIDIDSLISNIKSMDEANGAYQLIIKEKGSDEVFEMNYWIENEKGIYEYIFDGNDMGTGLDGYYYRTVIDQIPTIIDYQTGEYITSGTNPEFYSKHHSTLSDITIDNIFSEMLEGDIKVEMGMNSEGAQVINGEKVSICVNANAENPVVMVLDNRNETPVGYYACYGMVYAMPSISPKS